VYEFLSKLACILLCGILGRSCIYWHDVWTTRAPLTTVVTLCRTNSTVSSVWYAVRVLLMWSCGIVVGPALPYIRIYRNAYSSLYLLLTKVSLEV